MEEQPRDGCKRLTQNPGTYLPGYMMLIHDPKPTKCTYFLHVFILQYHTEYSYMPGTYLQAT